MKKIAKRPISKSGKDKKNEKTHLCNGGVLECGSKKDDNLPKKNGTEKNYVVSQQFCYIFVCLFVTDVTVLSRRGPIEGPRSIANVP